MEPSLTVRKDGLVFEKITIQYTNNTPPDSYSLPRLFYNSIYEYSHDQSDPAIAPDGKYVPRHHPIEYCDNYSHEITVMTQVTLKTIEQNDNVGMFSICFDGNSESEFEKFLMEFKDNATYNKDFNAILLPLKRI